MKVSLKWLKTLVEVPADVRELTNRLDLTGTAVEGVEVIGAALEGIVVGQVLTRERHPDADRLWVTTVDVGAHNRGEDGAPEPLQIVCGAQNFEAGDKVPVALVGATLPDGTRIKRAKMRGVESRGMNCSARELGLGADHAGLLILHPNAPVGLPIAEHLDLSDAVIDLEITPNRPDCMSMFGIAREVGALYERPYHLGRAVPEPPVGGSVEDLVRVSIADPGRCARYTARVIRGVRIGPSPDWLAERVTAAGARSINNIVDVTNYLMFEMGQPLHAFDLATLAKDDAGRAHIIVRAAADGERFTTLDGVERVLDGDITCIVDGNAAGGVEGTGGTGDTGGTGGTGATIALAGVMGGLASEVTEGTTDILLESATFSSAHTSRTSRKLQLFSEASARYERGVDAAACDECSARAAALMVEVAGGSLAEGVVDVYPLPPCLPELTLRVARLQAFIGAPIAAAEAQAILTRLGCTVRPAAEGPGGPGPGGPGGNSSDGLGAPAVDAPAPDLLVIPPSFRPDLTREIDLYEEVLRVWGMERVASTLPGGRGRIGEQTVEQQRLAVVGRALRASGLNETMTYAFASAADDALIAMPFEEHQQAVELINPMNSEQGIMRRSILPGLLRSVAYNQSRSVANVHLYETGTVFFASEGRKLPRERQMLAAVLAGSWTEGGWNDARVPLGFFDGKGIIENLLRELNIVKTRFRALEAERAPWLQPGRAAEVMAGSQQLGWLGEVHPRVCAAFEVAAPVVAFELDMKALLGSAQQARPYRDIPQFPAVSLDIALVVAADVSAEQVRRVITSAGGALLDDVYLFDVYRDEEKLGAGRKSLALTLSYRAPDRTLTFEEVEKLHQKVLGKLTAATGGELRS